MTVAHYDAVVVGGGTAGAAAAAMLAEQGRSVLLIDRRHADEAGARWINGVPPWCFEEAGCEVPSGDGLWAPTGDHDFFIRAASSRHVTRIASSPTLHVHMPELVRALHRRAVRAGVHCEIGSVRHLQFRHGRARRVLWRDQAKAERATEAALFVDATGGRGVLRQQVAAWQSQTQLLWCSAAQFQYAIADHDGYQRFLAEFGAEPGDTVARLGTHGGFSTVTAFTRVGGDEIGLLTGTLPADVQSTGDAMLRDFEARHAWLGARRWGGAGAIALRPLASPLAASGVALVGESGGQMYASHGSGVGMGLLGARHLADAVSGAADPGAADALTRYDRSFRQAHGGLLARSHAFFRLSRRLPSRAVAAMLRSGVLSDSALRAGLEQRDPPLLPELGFVKRLRRQ